MHLIKVYRMQGEMSADTIRRARREGVEWSRAIE